MDNLTPSLFLASDIHCRVTFAATAVPTHQPTVYPSFQRNLSKTINGPLLLNTSQWDDGSDDWARHILERRLVYLSCLFRNDKNLNKFGFVKLESMLPEPNETQKTFAIYHLGISITKMWFGEISGWVDLLKTNSLGMQTKTNENGIEMKIWFGF